MLLSRKGDHYEKHQSRDVDLFNQITSLSQLRDDQEHQSIIERNFFRKTASKYTEIFHNGSFKGVQVVSNCEEVLEQAANFSMNPSKDFSTSLSEDSLKVHDLTIIFVKNDPSLLEHSLTTLSVSEHSKSALTYVALSSLLISLKLLTPQHCNPLLASIVPPQTYLTVASDTLSLEDINTSEGILWVEHD